jgi:hypothetical protein
MTPPNLPDILARLANATPGPWHRMTVPDGDPIDGPTGEDRLTNCVGAMGSSHNETFIADANTDADADLIAHAPGDLAALAARVAELEAEIAAQRATLADSRVVRVLEQIGHAENDAVDFINASPYRADIVARLTELSDGQPRPFDGGIDRTLLRLGLDCGGPDTIVANPSAFRVLARLTVSTKATP